MATPTPFNLVGPKQIVSALDSNKVIDIEDVKYIERTKLQIWENNKTLNQKFL